ncbi:MAG TPA: acyl-CoA desaturase [Anaeromyxobacter sp.]
MRAALRRVAGVLAPSDPDRIHWLRSTPFLALQLGALVVPWLAGFGRREALFAAGTYAAGMFFVTAGYHRYFSHRAFRTSRAFQLVLALGAQGTVQKGVLWWAGHHRDHHRFSDGPRDVHSPSRGLLWSHVGWFLSRRHEATPLERVKDLARFPELRWLDRWHWVPPLALGVLVAALGGWSLAGAWLVGLFFLHHATFAINSLAHVWGTRPHPTGDGSRNNALLALITFGEGWHNSHHGSPSSARQGSRWWQLDVTWLLLRLLARLGVVWDVRPGPREEPRRAAPAVRASPARPIRAAGAVVAGLILVAPGGARAHAVERFTGTARGPDGAVLYLEDHVVELEGGRPRSAVTVYRGPAGDPIAELRTDFSADPFAPSYTFDDFRTGEIEAVSVADREVRLEARGRSRTVARPARLATGQGLDRLVRDRLAALARGDSLRVDYAVPGRLATYEFRIQARGADGDRVRVRVELASFLLRLVAPELDVEYDRESGRLLRYRGASNLSFGDGDNPRVEITYAYPTADVARAEEP